MKNRILFLAIMASLFAISYNSVAASFNDDQMKVSVKKGVKAKTLEFSIGNIMGQTTHVSIQNLVGEIGINTEIKNQYSYTGKMHLSLVPEGEYILLIENATSRYVRAFLMKDNDVFLFEEGTVQNAVTSSMSNNNSTNVNNKEKISYGCVRSLKNTSSNINFVFCETSERAYFQFFAVSDKGMVFENTQNIMKTINNKSKGAVASGLVIIK